MATPPAFDPNKPFTTEAAAPAFDPNKPFTQEAAAAPAFNPDAPFTEESSELVEFRNRPEAELEADEDFSPVQFGTRNRSALDPDTKAKLARVYRAKESKGTTLGHKLKSIFTGIPGAAKAIGGGLATGVKTVMDLNPVALGARVAGAASVNPQEMDRELRDIAGEEANIVSAVETGFSQTGDLIRRSGRAVKEGAGKVLPGVDSKAEKSPVEWESRLDDDIIAAQYSEKAGQGNGEIAKALGVDAPELAKIGVELNPETIQELSVLTDPVNFIPLGATVGVVGKFGGKLASRVIAATGTEAAAAKLASTLNRAHAVASGAADTALTKTGEAVEKAGERVQRQVNRAGAGSIGFGLGALLGGDIYKGLGTLVTAKAAPAAVKAAGKALQPGVVREVAGELASEFGKGVAEGAVLSVPFALGARPEEEESILGAVGLGGAIRATASQAPRVGRAAQNKLAETIFKEVDLADAPASQSYGTNPQLDALHETTAAALDPRSQKLLNWTREAFRDSGIEVYALDNESFAKRAGTGDAQGFFVNVGETLAPDGSAQPLRQIYLNGTTDALPHELFHALSQIDPESAKSLKDSVISSWTPEQKNYFQTLYNTLRNEGKPESQWRHRLTPEQVAEEAAAEVFSRLYLAQDLTSVSPSITQKAATFASRVLEKIGAPLTQFNKAGTEGTGISALGIRPSAESARVGQEMITGIAGRLQTEGNLAPRGPSQLLANVTPEDLTTNTGRPLNPRQPLGVGPQGARSDAAMAEALAPSGAETASPAPRAAEVAPAPEAPLVPAVTRRPTASTPAPSREVTGARNIRVTREQQDDFAAKRATETGVEAIAKAELDPKVKANVDTISQALKRGGSVVEIEHRGVKTPSGSDSPAGRTARRAEQEIPAAVRDVYQKTFVPVRWENTKSGPQLIAMSLDKVVANIQRVVKDVASAKVSDKLPYESRNGKLTDAAWSQVVDDLKAYNANQANGRRGDGKKLVRPANDKSKMSIPAENPGYSPVVLTEAKMNFLNMVQGLNPPLTARAGGRGTPGNIKGQELAELQGRKPEKPSVIRPQDINKQQFKGSDRTVKETNPLRNELAAAGVPVRELIEVTERINAKDIVTAVDRPELEFEAPVTDTTRAGFLPGTKETLRQYGEEIFAQTPEQWKKATDEMGGLTQGAYKLGLSAPDRGFVVELARLRDEAGSKFKSKIAEGDLDNAFPFATMGQFFSEAYGAATGGASARKGISLLKYGEDSIPFPNFEKELLGEKRAADFEANKPEKLFLPAANFDVAVKPITQAAIRTAGGRIFTGAWHAEALMNFIDAVSRGLIDERPPEGVKTLSEMLDGEIPEGFIEDGFVTADGTFLNRAQALDHAERIGQLKENTGKKNNLREAGVLETNEFNKDRKF